MVLVHATIMGGLPVVAEVWFSGPDYYGEYDSGVDLLYWRGSNGMPGKELPENVLERLEKRDPDWQSYVTEQASDWLGEHCPTRYPDGTVVGSYSAEYRKLNPARAASVDERAKRQDPEEGLGPKGASAVPAEERADAHPSTPKS